MAAAGGADLGQQARALARALVGLVVGEGRGRTLLRLYERRTGRVVLHGSPELRRETIAALEREALLLAAAYVERALPERLGAQFARHERDEAAARFQQIFLSYLGGVLGWDPQERQRFLSDLSLYLHLAERGRAAASRGQLACAEVFVQRCAFLLDASLVEQAQPLAVQFARNVMAHAERALRAVFGRPGAATARSARGRGSGWRRP
jgi:hypothetical protein